MVWFAHPGGFVAKELEDRLGHTLLGIDGPDEVEVLVVLDDLDVP